MKKQSFLLILPVLLWSTCTDVITISEEFSSDEILVVEGNITNDLGPYTIRLSTSVGVDGIGTNTLGLGARVTIESSAGEEELLQEVGDGFYRTSISGIRGEIGEAYRIAIVLSNGSQYQSNFEHMPEVVDISSLNVKFIDETFEDEDGVPRRRLEHALSGEFLKDEGVDKFFKVDVEGVFEARISIIGIGCTIPTPPTTLCYATRNPLANSVRVLEDTNVNQDSYSADIVAIPVDQQGKYLAKVVINSFSANAFSFWSSVNDQLEKSGSIFDSPIPPVIGNIRNVNSEQFALGYFSASAISRDQICIDRTDIEVIVDVPASCGRNCIQIWDPASFSRSEIAFCD